MNSKQCKKCSCRINQHIRHSSGSSRHKQLMKFIGCCIGCRYAKCHTSTVLFPVKCRQCLKYQKCKNCIFAHMCSFAHRIFNFLCHLFQFRPGMFPSKHLIPHLNNPVTHMPADFRRLRIRLCGKLKNNHSPYNNQRNTDNSPYTFSFHCYPLIHFFFHNRNCFL